MPGLVIFPCRGVLMLALGALVAAPGAAQEWRQAAELLWHQRDETGGGQGRVDDQRSRDLVAAHERVLSEAPDSLEAHWKLLRTLWFRGEHALEDQEAKRELYGRGVVVARAAVARLAAVAETKEDLDELSPDALAAAVRPVPEAVPVLFWSAVAWGLWGDVSGKLEAARQGVGGRIRDYAEAVIRLDDTFDHAGGHRLLGRLHTEAPKIPFFTGWVDRDRALSELERAVELAPDYLLNRWYLADALLKHRPRERPRARALLEDLVRRAPAPTRRVEDARVLEQARAALAGLS